MWYEEKKDVGMVEIDEYGKGALARNIHHNNIWYEVRG
jgi:hypothetical protein